LVGGKVMITAILIVLLLLLFAAMGFIYVIFVHLTLKKEYEDKNWMDDDEFDYGHDIKHYNETDNF
jgi:hypothetical protein